MPIAFFQTFKLIGSRFRVQRLQTTDIARLNELPGGFSTRNVES